MTTTHTPQEEQVAKALFAWARLIGFLADRGESLKIQTTLERLSQILSASHWSANALLDPATTAESTPPLLQEIPGFLSELDEIDLGPLQLWVVRAQQLRREYRDALDSMEEQVGG